MKKECIECGEPFSGRADAKFCSDQCRSNYHNRQGSDQSGYVRKVNAILRKNRKILNELNPDGKTRVNKTDLTRQGFDFAFITNTYITKTGKEYKFCYDQGYIHTGDDWYTLVVKHEYV
jgi:hypothetical protein